MKWKTYDPESCRIIYDEYLNSKMTVKEIAQKYDITERTFYNMQNRIKNGENQKKIPKETSKKNNQMVAGSSQDGTTTNEISNSRSYSSSINSGTSNVKVVTIKKRSKKDQFNDDFFNSIKNNKVSSDKTSQDNHKIQKPRKIKSMASLVGDCFEI